MKSELQKKISSLTQSEKKEMLKLMSEGTSTREAVLVVLENRKK